MGTGAASCATKVPTFERQLGAMSLISLSIEKYTKFQQPQNSMD